MKKEGQNSNNTEKPKLGISDVMVRFLPLTWFVWIMWKLDFLKRDYKGCYRGDPESFGISRWVFEYIPIRRITQKGANFCGNWHLFRLIYWEVHLLIIEKSKPKPKKERITFP